MLAVLCAFLLLGCRTAPAPKYPIGLYNVPATAFAEVKNAGFNLVTGPPKAEFLDAARAAGLQVLASSAAAAAVTNETIRARIQKLDPHPALWGWYLFDEPDLHRIPPAELAEFNRTLKSLASKPSVLVLMSGNSAIYYGDHCDIAGLDFYPVPWAPISQFGKEMRAARQALGDKPYFAIIQAFDWTAFSDLLDTEVSLRPPTDQELRCMTYLALAREANGLFFYSYDARTWYLPDQPLWHGLKELVAEVNRHLPLFTAEHLWWSPPLQYLDGTDSMYNEIREAKISLSLLQVNQGNQFTPPGRYVLAINTVGEPVPFRLQLPPVTAPAVPILGQFQAAPVTNSVITKTFAPYEVICYGPL